MVTFAQAQEIVRTQLQDRWTPGSGTLYVSPDGFEDRDYWLVRAGAREALVDDDPRFVIYGDCEMVVDKATGRIVLMDCGRFHNRLSSMTPVHG